MSDEKKTTKAAAKRGYRVGGVTLSYDLRVRITEADYKALQRYAKQHKTTAAAAARQLLQIALHSSEK